MLQTRDAQVNLLKQENATLRAEKRIFETKYRRLIREVKEHSEQQ